MGQRDDARDDLIPPGGATSAEVAYDRRWAGDLRSAIQCSSAILSLLVLIDWGAGRLTVVRGGLWVGLGVLLFLVLVPPRVTTGEGWLASRGLVRARRVRTDLLVSVRVLDGVSQRLRLRDVLGNRVEIDPQVLVNNPDLWHHLERDALRSAARGSLTCGETSLRQISQRIDRETALTVFKVSGLE
ncbi:hypothetical protein [Streptomyces sp. ME18-1-4]|uniref:hypothetical protein n=1 Tax=Streptomyces sp. ME18-1-4 TaxID=3028685 RepID=UPI0029B30104|nr:hypothetical protein [Streptomyces sp. ME18-1-4]MDX3240293.1 hypothetical protein [Streptomyces sp. ME18-1-4]